jgi:hypothetical protein
MFEGSSHMPKTARIEPYMYYVFSYTYVHKFNALFILFTMHCDHDFLKLELWWQN